MRNNYKGDPVKLHLATCTRDEIACLDLNDPHDMQKFDEKALNYIKALEIDPRVDIHRAYNDAHPHADIEDLDGKEGKITVGIGFNMDKGQAAKDEWAAVFGNLAKFEAVKAGKEALTDDEVQRLFNYNIYKSEETLRSWYKGSWDKFTPNEKLSLISTHFNSGRTLIGPTKRFHGYMVKYAETRDEAYKNKAYEELKHHSNKPDNLHWTGTQVRRDCDSAMLETSEAIRLNQKLEEGNKLRVLPEKTKVPRGLNTSESNNNYSEYFIWRTQLDNKVRYEHTLLEGKVFKRGEAPEKGYNCRCYEEALTNDFALDIIGPNGKRMSTLEHFIRYGGDGVFIL